MSKMTLPSLLSYPFEQGVLTVAKNAKTLTVNAPYWHGVDIFDNVTAVTPFYPDYASWKERGIEAFPEIMDSQECDIVLCLIPKQKDFAYSMIAQSLKALSEQGIFIFVAANDAGGKRLEKWVQEFGVETQSLSKSKARIVWGFPKGLKDNIASKFIENGAAHLRQMNDYEFWTQAGIFGWDKIDRGSALLAQYLPENLKGIGADFGCGYGFLSDYILSKPNEIQRLDAIDADYNAVQCAQENLKKFDGVQIKWDDLTAPIENTNIYDFIVMNPPFHVGKKTDSDIGQKFIKNAHHALKKNGALYMVANAYLAYEKIMQDLFVDIEKYDEKDGFKVYKAVK